MTPDAEILGVRFTKGAIRSRAALTYAEAQARIDDASQTDEISNGAAGGGADGRRGGGGSTSLVAGGGGGARAEGPAAQSESTAGSSQGAAVPIPRPPCYLPTPTHSSGLRRLNSLAKKLRAGRVARGALQLASPEVKFELGDDEAHDPIDVGVYQVWLLGGLGALCWVGLREGQRAAALPASPLSPPLTCSSRLCPCPHNHRPKPSRLEPSPLSLLPLAAARDQPDG
jgi:hypothetical protein